MCHIGLSDNIQARVYNINKGSMNMVRQWGQKRISELVNITFAYLGVLTNTDVDDRS